MNFAETAEVLAAVQIYDSRRVDEATVRAWHKIIGRFTKEDCINAVVEHYTNSTDWLMPAHITGRVKKVRARRIELVEHPSLNYSDEYDVDGEPEPGAKQRQSWLVEGIANGDITADQYEQYRAKKISLDGLLAQTRELD